MISLRDDSFARKPPGTRRRRSSGVVIFALMLLSVALLVLSRIDNPALRHARNWLSELAAPALTWAATSFAPVRKLREQAATLATSAGEIERLRADAQRLAGWEARAHELERRLADLAALARVVQEPGIEFLTGRVITDAGGPFARSALVSMGRESGVRAGFPVISADGVVGRVLETGGRASRILLLTDLNSRVPVLVGEQSLKGILIGDNGVRPRLAHLPAGILVKNGDRVVTSGVGGLFPRGLRVGSVVETPTGPHVALHARLDDLDHVSVLFHRSPALDLMPELVRPQAAPAQPGRRSVAGQPVPPEPGQSR